MTIAVISMIRDNWGGSEELWAAMAEEALEQQHTVLHLCYGHENIHPKMQSLINKGLIVYTRPSYKEISSEPLIQLAGKSINFLRKKFNLRYWSKEKYRERIHQKMKQFPAVNVHESKIWTD